MTIKKGRFGILCQKNDKVRCNHCGSFVAIGELNQVRGLFLGKQTTIYCCRCTVSAQGFKALAYDDGVGGIQFFQSAEAELIPDQPSQIPSIERCPDCGASILTTGIHICLTHGPMI